MKKCKSLSFLKELFDGGIGRMVTIYPSTLQGLTIPNAYSYEF